MKEFDKLCKGCMKKLNGEEICPFCGFNQNEKQSSPYLEIGAVLEKRYSIGKVIDNNSEGIGYIAYDNVSNVPVYIKEFFPSILCYRASNGHEVVIKSGCESQFKEYMNSFLTYLRAVARLRSLSAIVPVYNIFTENSTAYAVYEWVNGLSFVDFLRKKDNHISWDTARTLFMPLLSSLSEMNSVGIQHLGICPENILITDENKLKLFGFSIPEIRKQGSHIPPTLYDGFSAIEQYLPEYQTNESTDVYAFAATLFFALTGSAPQKALKRKTDDRIFIPTNLLKEIPEHVISALANALQVFPSNRTATFERLREALSASSSVINNINIYENTEKDIIPPSPNNCKQKSHVAVSIILGVTAFIILVSAGVFWLFGNNFSFNNLSQSSGNSVTSSDPLSDYSAASSSTSKIPVPNLIGQNYKSIQSQQNLEYQVLVSSEEYNDNIAEGIIMSQTPKNTEQIEKGATILVTVSKGSKTRTLPAISGIPITEASQKVTSAGLIPTQKQEYNDTVSVGIVVGYDGHNPGDLVESGSEVVIIVSKGKKTQ